MVIGWLESVLVFVVEWRVKTFREVLYFINVH
jgi:hypothetical protein